MGSIHHQNRKTKSHNLNLLLLVIKFLASVFFLSVLFLSSSLLQIFSSSNIGKNYMFLVCNGILVLIVTSSGLEGNSLQEIKPMSNKVESSQKSLELSLSGIDTVVSEEKVAMEAEEVEETDDKCLVLMKVGVEGEQANEIVEEEEEEEEEDNESLSAEELNKKCEDFIRKMKEVIKFEAQQLT